MHDNGHIHGDDILFGKPGAESRAGEMLSCRGWCAGAVELAGQTKKSRRLVAESDRTKKASTFISDVHVIW